jgi:hypothetical protein
MPKQFYQTDVAESDTDSIWTGSIYYTETPEEAEFLTMLELQQDWGDGYMPEAFLIAFGEERRDGCDPDPEFPGADAWNEAGYWSDLSVTTGMLVLPPVQALAQLGKIEFNVSDDDIAAVMDGRRRLTVAVIV